MCDTPRILFAVHVKIRVWTCEVVPRRFSGWVTSRGGNTRRRGLGDGYPEGGVGVQGRGRIRGGARRKGGGEKGGGDGRPRAINIPKYAGNPRAYTYVYLRVRARALTSLGLCQYMPSTYANCKYNLSGPGMFAHYACMCARTNCKRNNIALAHMLHIGDMYFTREYSFRILGSLRKKKLEMRGDPQTRIM